MPTKTKKRGARASSARERRIRVAIAKRVLDIYNDSGFDPKLSKFALRAYRLLKAEGKIKEEDSSQPS